MAAPPNGLLAPHPPHLFSVAERQAFSGSSASCSSSSASSASTEFGRLSRNSSGSAYLTDYTPPISPAQSNGDLKLADRDPGGSQSCFGLNKAQSNPVDHRVRVHSEMGVPRDKGYSADNESDELGFDTFAAIKSKLGRASQSINTRRALQIMERRTKARSSRPDEQARMPSLSSRVVVTEIDSSGLEDWSRELSSTCTIQTSDISLEDANSSIALPPSESASGLLNDPAAARSDCSAYQDSAIVSPRMPPKPVIQPTQLDQECSPLSLYSQDFSSSVSVSLLLMSPPNLDASDACSSPAIWNDSIAHGVEPFSSPVEAISTGMFSSRIRRHAPTALTGEDLDIASLMRLEAAASLGMQSTPNPRTSALSAQCPPAPQSPYYEESWEARDDPSFVRWHAEAIFANPNKDGLPNDELSGPAVDIQKRADQAEQCIVGLGLGGLAESSLCSSSSISRLSSAANPNADDPSVEKVKDGCGDDRKLPSAAVKSAQLEIEPRGALSHQSASATSVVEELSLSPILNLPSKLERLRQPPQHKEQQPRTQKPPVIEPPALQVKPRVLAPLSPPKTMRRRDFVKSRSPVRPRQDKEAEEKASLPDDPGDILDRYAEISNLEFRHLPLQPSKAMQAESKKLHEIEQHPALHETNPPKPPSFQSSRLAPLNSKLSDKGAQARAAPVRLSGLPKLADDESSKKPKLEVEIGSCGNSHKSFPLPDFQPYRDSQASSSTSHRQQATPSWVRDDYSPSGSRSCLLTPDNDPRSPCSPSAEYFQRNSYISSRRSALSASSHSSDSGISGPSKAETTTLSDPSANPSLLGRLANASAEGPKDSNTGASVGVGLPSDLASRPPRQRESSSSSVVGLADGMQLGTLPSTASCQNLAQLASGRSSDPHSPSAEMDAPAEQQLEDSSPLVMLTKFAKRCLSAIPEQNTPSPSASPCRLRMATPYSPPPSPPRSDFSLLNRLRSPRSPSSAPRGPSPLGRSSDIPEAHVARSDTTLDDRAKSAGPNTQNLFKRYFRAGKESRSPIPRPLMDAPQTPPSVASPGVIEYPDAPKGLKIFKRHGPTVLDSRASGRPRSPFRSFKVLF